MTHVTMALADAEAAGAVFERQRNGTNKEIRAVTQLIKDEQRIYGIINAETSRRLALLEEERDVMKLPTRDFWIEVMHKDGFVYFRCEHWSVTGASFRAWARENGISYKTV